MSAAPLTMPWGVCGFLKRSMPASGSGLTVMIFAPLALAFSRAESMRGWFVPGFWLGDDDQVGSVEVVEQDAALADAYGLVEGRAGRLVAHVRAVRQIVRAELAGEELVQEGGLVAGAARGVEEGFVGGAERGQFLGDDVEGAFPGDGLVVVGALGQVHGVGEAALLAEPVAAAAA